MVRGWFAPCAARYLRLPPDSRREPVRRARSPSTTSSSFPRMDTSDEGRRTGTRRPSSRIAMATSLRFRSVWPIGRERSFLSGGVTGLYTTLRGRVQHGWRGRGPVPPRPMVRSGAGWSGEGRACADRAGAVGRAYRVGAEWLRRPGPSAARCRGPRAAGSVNGAMPGPISAAPARSGLLTAQCCRSDPSSGQGWGGGTTLPPFSARDALSTVQLRSEPRRSPACRSATDDDAARRIGQQPRGLTRRFTPDDRGSRPWCDPREGAVCIG